MRKFLSILIISLLVTGGLYAQDQDRDQKQVQQHFTMKDGKMYHIRNQEQVQLLDQLRLENGCVVNPDGSYQFKNRQQQLRNGEYLDMQGNRYKSQQEFQRQMKVRSQAMAQEHLMFQDGQLYRIQNQEKIQLRERVKLNNGIVVNPDGTCIPNGGNQFKLKDGECMDMEGRRYENQERYHQKMEQRMSKEMKMEKGKGNKPEKGKMSGKKGGGKN